MPLDQTEQKEGSGNWLGDNANKKRRVKSTTGASRMNSGGGDRGGRRIGSVSKETVKATSSIADLGPKHRVTEPYDINQAAVFGVFLTAEINRAAADHGRCVMHL
ncbi:hypothetical protein Nepgr_030169 [Nepenthes gracilis]|uniref:Uncharacterized protein n=1 Tax=Nepenthes gracilis TaxID=150966 RepID=A0AAD3TG86_NEPGR|nr:hypothetical protein Nepgr_030169 [Nepenthes gracilis]